MKPSHIFFALADIDQFIRISNSVWTSLWGAGQYTAALKYDAPAAPHLGQY